MTLPELLTLKFPAIDFDNQVTLKDVGNGPEINEWNMIGVSRPTKKDLDKWKTEVQAEWERQQVETKFKEINKEVLDKLNEIDLKTIRALREDNKDRLSQLEQEAAEIRATLITT